MEKQNTGPAPASSAAPAVGRAGDRADDAMRPVVLEPGAAPYAEGSCLASFGGTRVLCAATVEQRVPPWLRDSGKGWITAEYGMLPRATHKRTDREAARGRQSGRTQEIQRLIGRSLRAAVDLTAMADIQIRIDCDVLQADGGTRTAAVTGAYVALACAAAKLVSLGVLKQSPLRDSVAAVSCGVSAGRPLLDLDYAEDSTAGTDANFVITGGGNLVEVQASAEGAPFDEAALQAMLALAQKGAAELAKLQADAVAAV
ncbi:MAG: ribonuclease PH [Rhodospirillales bacterium]